MTKLPLSAPRLDLLPRRAALPAGQDSDLTVLVRILPAEVPAPQGSRPPLNLALVIDRSGSMAGLPFNMAVQAAQVGLRMLEPHDRVSVLAFAQTVKHLLPPQFATDREALCRQVEGLSVGGPTALYAGWLDGAIAVAQHLDPRAINRVLLLSDGRANVGKCSLQAILPDVAGLTQRGVTTSAIGLGPHDDEDLLGAMAAAGDGNFGHIEDPAALPSYFEAEFSGLARTAAQAVSLGAEPHPALGPLRVEVHNDLKRTPRGRLRLPNLLAGQPTEVVLSLRVPAQPLGADAGVLRVRLAWTGRDGIRRRVWTPLALPVLAPEAYASVPENAEVRLALEVQRNAQAKREAARRLDQGDLMGAQATLRELEDLEQHLPREAGLTRQHDHRSRGKS
ncbi:vWA domain-containing protein [Deinococcus murrayi]|uniref:vWA domain-containing protein n=1 Tax=Deinococcus murrayi TaxID=68910 RepID=UPI00068676F8|nr:VWA domain-containing protein [Deinococcus murrayi]